METTTVTAISLVILVLGYFEYSRRRSVVRSENSPKCGERSYAMDTDFIESMCDAVEAASHGIVVLVDDGFNVVASGKKFAGRFGRECGGKHIVEVLPEELSALVLRRTHDEQIQGIEAKTSDGEVLLELINLNRGAKVVIFHHFL